MVSFVNHLVVEIFKFDIRWLSFRTVDAVSTIVENDLKFIEATAEGCAVSDENPWNPKQTDVFRLADDVD